MLRLRFGCTFYFCVFGSVFRLRSYILFNFVLNLMSCRHTQRGRKGERGGQGNKESNQYQGDDFNSNTILNCNDRSVYRTREKKPEFPNDLVRFSDVQFELYTHSDFVQRNNILVTYNVLHLIISYQFLQKIFSIFFNQKLALSLYLNADVFDPIKQLRFNCQLCDNSDTVLSVARLL